MKERLTLLQERLNSDAVRDVALLVGRIVLAWVFIYHGAGTLFGAFNGLGFHRSAIFFSNTAHLHPGGLFAVMSGIVEFFGGIGIGLGLLGRLAALGLVGDMVIAMITVTFQNGFVSSNGTGYELNVALIGLAAVIAGIGTGRIGLDVPLRKLVVSYSRPVVGLKNVGVRTQQS